MNSNWQTKKLGDVCVIKPPKSEARKTLSSGELVSFVPMEDLGIFTKQFSALQERKLKDVSGSYTYFANGDVLMAKITPCFENGKIGIADGLKNGIGFGSSEYFVFRPKEEIYSDYLYYFLSTDDFREEGRKVMSGAVGHKRVPKEFVENYEIPLPSKDEQERIVKRLDEVFEKVTRAKEAAEKNLQNVKELFESYLQSVFTNRGKNWDEQNLDTLCDIEYGYTDKAKKSGAYRFIRITDTDKDGLLTQENKMYVDSFKGVSKYILSNGDLLMARTGASAGHVMFFESDEESVFASYLIRIKFKKEIFSKLYWFYSRSKLYWDQVRQLSAGSAQPQFNGGAVKKISFAFPKFISEQKTIVKKLDELLAETKKLEKIYGQKLADLEELKKSVLSKAFHAEL